MIYSFTFIHYTAYDEVSVMWKNFVFNLIYLLSDKFEAHVDTVNEGHWYKVKENIMPPLRNDLNTYHYII